MSYQIYKAKLKNKLTPSVSSYFSLSQCQFFSFLVGVSSILVQLYIYSYPNLYKPNLSKGEQKAMEELAKREDVMITNAEKSGAVVIMNIEKQISEASYPISATTRSQKKTQRCNTVVWLTIQLIGLKKKINFLKNQLTD